MVTLAIISGIFIAIATIGFVLIPELFDGKISDKKEKAVELISKQKSVFNHIEKANSCNRETHILGGLLDILKGQIQNESILAEKEGIIQSLRINAVVYAINSAIGAGIISKEGASEEISKLRMDMSPKDLSSKFEDYSNKSAAHTGILQSEIDEINKAIIVLSKWKSRAWLFCLACQSTGMLLAIIALFFR